MTRTGAAAGHEGYFHEAALFSSDDELLDVVIPFIDDGVAACEPTFVALDRDRLQLVERVAGTRPGLTYIDAAEQYARPAVTIRSFRDVLSRRVAAGAHQIRVVGEVPHPGSGVPWDAWSRYEAVVNRALAAFPLWGVCPYDVRRTPDHVLEDVLRTHPHVATRDTRGVRHDRNDRFEDPAAFIRAHRAPALDPLELRHPLLSLDDPTPSEARSAVVDAMAASATPPVEVARLADLAVAVSETVTNACVHGCAPVTVRAWTGPDRCVVTVHDRGPGPADPFVGLVPSRDGARGGLGLWLAHQMCDHVSLFFGDGGFTVRLVNGTPHVGVGIDDACGVDRPG